MNFPIMKAVRKDLVEVEDKLGRIRQLPWKMIEKHKKQAKANHSQSLQKLAERGGLCVTEAVAVLNDKGFREQFPEFKIGVGISAEDYEAALTELHSKLKDYEGSDELERV